MIAFIPQNSDSLIFSEVEVNQFFINCDGDLCQKSSESVFTIVADAEGEPYSDYFDEVSENMKIKKILPKIKRIDF